MLCIFSKGLSSSILSRFVKCACMYNLSASGAVRPQLDIHSIIGNPFLKFLATPLGGCGIHGHGHMHIEAFKRRAGLLQINGSLQCLDSKLWSGSWTHDHSKQLSLCSVLPV